MTPERWQQITGMFHAALLRDSGQRRTFLQDACGADEPLRAEVEAMLAAHDNAGDPGSIPAVAVSEQMLRLQSGSAVGRYRIDALIGAGGMGQVYRARDPQIERDVAIKVLPADFAADAERLRRFEQEAHASGALNHPNVMTLYDVGTADGRPYLVMELLDGETLRDCVGRGAMPAARACEIAAAIARGLAAAHARGIVHRDLKPENVMVTRDGRVKILDFGIAKLRVRDPHLDQRTATTPLRTAADTMLGTAGYMAPEQIRGEPADERADLFALGAMLFELLTGRRAFDRESRVETLNAILHDDVPALGAAAANVPVALDRIVRRCLEKDPDARFQSARDLAFALDTAADTGDADIDSRRAAAGSSTGALAGSRRHRSRRQWRRRLCDVAAPAFTCSADTRAGALRAAAAAGPAIRGRAGDLSGWHTGCLSRGRGPDRQTAVVLATPRSADDHRAAGNRRGIRRVLFSGWEVGRLRGRQQAEDHQGGPGRATGGGVHRDVVSRRHVDGGWFDYLRVDRAWAAARCRGRRNAAAVDDSGFVEIRNRSPRATDPAWRPRVAADRSPGRSTVSNRCADAGNSGTADDCR